MRVNERNTALVVPHGNEIKRRRCYQFKKKFKIKLL